MTGSVPAPVGGGIIGLRPALAVKINGLVPLLASSIEELPAAAAHLESLGVDQLVLGHHWFSDPETTHPGSIPLDPNRVSLDPLVVIAGLATRTQNLRFATGGLIASLYHPLALAKSVATLDQLSGGRFELGLVAGWQQSEFAAAGVPFDERFGRMIEAVQVCRAVWSGSPFSFEGRWLTVGPAYSQPLPISGARLPIHLGGGATRPALARVVRYGDGWIASEAADAATIKTGCVLLRQLCAESGVAASRFAIRATASPGGGVADVRAALSSYLDAGATVVTLPLASWARSGEEALEVLAAAVSTVHEAGRVHR